MSGTPRPTQLDYHRRSKLLEVRFDDDTTYRLPAEYLRVFSPSAEVKGHGPGQEVLQVGKEAVAIERIEPVGHYAVRLHFDDGHNTGLYTWRVLRTLGERQEENWQTYLARLAKSGYARRS